MEQGDSSPQPWWCPVSASCMDRERGLVQLDVREREHSDYLRQTGGFTTDGSLTGCDSL